MLRQGNIRIKVTYPYPRRMVDFLEPWAGEGGGGVNYIKLVTRSWIKISPSQPFLLYLKQNSFPIHQAADSRERANEVLFTSFAHLPLPLPLHNNYFISKLSTQISSGQAKRSEEDIGIWPSNSFSSISAFTLLRPFTPSFPFSLLISLSFPPSS